MSCEATLQGDDESLLQDSVFCILLIHYIQDNILQMKLYWTVSLFYLKLVFNHENVFLKVLCEVLHVLLLKIEMQRLGTIKCTAFLKGDFSSGKI